MLEVQNLSCNYGNQIVLKNISFTLDNGHSLSILGANGCGKTTLLRCIASQKDYSGLIK